MNADDPRQILPDQAGPTDPAGGASPQHEAPPVSARFGAARASVTLLLVILVQVLVGIVIGVMALIWFRPDVRARSAIPFVFPLAAPALVLSGVLMGATTLAIARLWAWPLVLDRTASGLGLRWPGRRQLTAWTFAGAALSFVSLALPQWLAPPPSHQALGPIARLAAGAGAVRATWAVMAVLVAPPVEEFLFRGLLLRGFTSSWGVPAAGAVVTVLFAALHLPETVYYWPASLAVLALAVMALAARVRSGSLLPAVAVHAAYNLVIVAWVYLA